MKKTVIRLVVALISALVTLLATASVHACVPYYIHQPKAPKSLIKED